MTIKPVAWLYLDEAAVKYLQGNYKIWRYGRVTSQLSQGLTWLETTLQV